MGGMSMLRSIPLSGSFDQSQEAIVLDVLSEDVHQDGVVDVIKASFDVAFDEPLRAHLGLGDLVEGCVASPFRSESVAVCGELWFIIGFQMERMMSCTTLSDHTGRPSGRFPLWACR